MRIKAVAAIAFLVTTLSATHLSATASTSVEAPAAQPFELSARMNNMPQLSRSEIDPTSTTRILPNADNMSALSYAPALPVPLLPRVAPPAVSVPFKTSVQHAAEVDAPGALSFGAQC